ncbi:MAG: hypothetical protein LBC85_07455 [Fibromonadaceae bacterium]|jgi:hypothetical protein|nr:hypothetical protein [Fibromonadaceae bacterium]
MKTGISYFGVRNPKWVRKDMRAIKEAGFDYVLHTFSEADLQYYPQTMKEIIALSKEEGLGVYTNPWGVGRVFGGEAYSELTARNKEMGQISLDGEALIAACPNSKGFREYMQKWIKNVCESEVETIFWDEPHFYFEKNKTVSACRCSVCSKLYREQTGEEIPETLSEKFNAFRQRSLVSFLSFVTEEVHKFGKRNSVCLLPPWFPAGLENWDEVAALPCVDEIGSDPYWEKGDALERVQKIYGETSVRIADLAKKYGKEAQMWVKNYHIEAGTEHFIKEATEISVNAGITNIFAWSYLGSKYMDWLRSDNPELVWETQIKALSLAKAHFIHYNYATNCK